jgi:hypothetical protein
MQRFRHASPGAGSDGSQPGPAEDWPVQSTDVVRAGKSEASSPAPEGTRPSFLLVLLRALSAWSS